MNLPINALANWLQDLGLGEYAESFASQKIGFDLLPELLDADLRELGITALGDRKRLLKAIAALRAGTEVEVSPVLAAPTPVPAPPSVARDAERRQLTVMFCDLVGSTALSRRLDPEDLQQVIRRFHETVAAAVAPYDGHVAQLLGDGVLVYFGYPRAHEDDAMRAVRSGLNVLDAVARLRPAADLVLQTRVGIATGLVVVGEVVAGAAAEQTASGETPNLAARLQAVALPGEIVLSDETRRLVGASFAFESTGRLELKGFAVPVEAWRVRGERSVASRFEAQHDTELIEFIGRNSEVSLLLERWNLAREGEGQVVLLSGDPGIGKSRISQTLRERLAAESSATVLLQCSPYFSNSALYPIVQYFERASGIAAADPPALREEKLARLAGPEIPLSSATFGYLLRMLGLPDGGRVGTGAENPQQEKALTLQAPIDLLRGLTQQVPVLMLIEDAHWIDPTTEELVRLTIEQLRGARLLILVTSRPEYLPSWANAANLTRLTLTRLGQRQCAALVDAVTGGKTLPPEVLAEIIAKTDGIPLFVEELTKTVLQSGLLEETPTGYELRGPLPALAIPSTLQDSLMARLDKLAPAKEVAQLGAMIGREFSRQLLAAVLQLPPAELAVALDELVTSELVSRRGTGDETLFTFKHALIRDTAYNSMLRGQRVLRHGQIAAAIERTEPDTVAGQPELLAYHYQAGGNPGAAFGYWRQAGELASARLAGREAIAHYRAALALLPELQARPENDEFELDIQGKLGNLLMQTEGFASPQTAASFTAARELAMRLGQIDKYAMACAGTGTALWAGGRYTEALQLLEHLSADERARLQPMSRVFISLVMAFVKFHLGALADAAAMATDAIRALDEAGPEQWQDIGGADPRVAVRVQLIAINIHRGYLAQAEALSQEVMRVGRERAHPPTQGWALSMARWLAFLKGNPAESVRVAREALALSERLGFKSRIKTGQMLLGRALVAAGEISEGTRLLRSGFTLWTAEGAVASGSEYAAVAADVLIDAGSMADAAEFLAIAEQIESETLERHFEAEILRLRGRLMQAEGQTGQAAERYGQALAAAERQGAKLFSLRAATDIAALLRSQGKAAEAKAVLQPVYDWFTEGFDYPDLVRAKALLDAR